MQILFLPVWAPVIVSVYLMCNQRNANILQTPTYYIVNISYRKLHYPSPGLTSTSSSKRHRSLYGSYQTRTSIHLLTSPVNPGFYNFSLWFISQLPIITKATLFFFPKMAISILLGQIMKVVYVCSKE